MHEIYFRYTIDMTEKSNMTEIYLRFAGHITGIYLRYPRDMLEIYLRYD